MRRFLSGRGFRVRPANHQDSGTPRGPTPGLVDASMRTPVMVKPPLPHRVPF